ncbi:MAG: NERD domain-containing protein [Chloroflexi bacterium]|nr:NERD domain-containing protein [Chloroflexota bacterium]
MERRSKAAKRVSLAGLAIMLPGMLVAFGGLINESLQSSTAILISYVSLIAGTVIATIGGRLAEQWLIEPRNDQRLERALKGLDRRYRLVNYYTPAAHLLLAPTGVYVAVLKDENGPIAFNGRRWTQPFSLGRAWREWRHGGLGHPTAEAELQIERLRKWLAPKLGDAAIDIKPLVLFSDPKAELEIAPGHDFIMPLRQLKPYLLERKNDLMPAADYQRMVDAIGLADSDARMDDDDKADAPAETAASTRGERKRKRRSK